MPHYADGTLAQAGDIVVGTTYNRPGKCIGIIESITSASDTCNCQVRIFARVFGDTRLVNTDVDYSECKVLTKVL